MTDETQKQTIVDICALSGVLLLLREGLHCTQPSNAAYKPMARASDAIASKIEALSK